MSHDFVLDVIRRADPYPNEVPGPLPTDPQSASKTLTEIDMRSRTMQTQESLRTGWLRKQTSFRPFRAAAIAAAVVVMAGLGIWLAAGQDSDGPVAAGSGPVEIAEEFLINLDAGSAEEAAALVSSDHSGLLVPVVGRLTGLGDMVGFFEFYAATGGRTDFSGCVDAGVQVGRIVTCDITQTSDLVEVLQSPPIEGTIAFRIVEGEIRSASLVFDSDTIIDYRAARVALDDWIRENRPEEASALFNGDANIWSEEAGRTYLGLAGEYAAGGGS